MRLYFFIFNYIINIITRVVSILIVIFFYPVNLLSCTTNCKMVDKLDKYIDSYSKEWYQAFLLLLMAGTPGIFNAIQISSYVFLVDKPSYWCDIPVLKAAGWSDQMLLNVSTP